MKKLSVLLPDETWQFLRERSFTQAKAPAVLCREVLVEWAELLAHPASDMGRTKPLPKLVAQPEPPKEEKLSAARQALLGWKSEARRK